jgi:hypothetical protein
MVMSMKSIGDVDAVCSGVSKNDERVYVLILDMLHKFERLYDEFKRLSEKEKKKMFDEYVSYKNKLLRKSVGKVFVSFNSLARCPIQGLLYANSRIKRVGRNYNVRFASSSHSRARRDGFLFDFFLKKNIKFNFPPDVRVEVDPFVEYEYNDVLFVSQPDFMVFVDGYSIIVDVKSALYDFERNIAKLYSLVADYVVFWFRKTNNILLIDVNDVDARNAALRIIDSMFEKRPNRDFCRYCDYKYKCPFFKYNKNKARTESEKIMDAVMRYFKTKSNKSIHPQG